MDRILDPLGWPAARADRRVSSSSLSATGAGLLQERQQFLARREPPIVCHSDEIIEQVTIGLAEVECSVVKDLLFIFSNAQPKIAKIEAVIELGEPREHGGRELLLPGDCGRDAREQRDIFDRRTVFVLPASSVLLEDNHGSFAITFGDDLEDAVFQLLIGIAGLLEQILESLGAGSRSCSLRYLLGRGSSRAHSQASGGQAESNGQMSRQAVDHGASP